jgi:hypothetical protein
VVALLVMCVTIGSVWASAGASTGNDVLDDAALEDAVLTLDDLPAGWSEDRSLPPLAAEPTGGFCDGPNEAARADAAGAVASTQIAFADGADPAAVVIESAFAFPTAKAAKKFMKTTRAAVEGCPDWKAETDAGTVTRSVASIPFRELGDDTIAVRITGVPEGATSGSSVDQVVVREGNHVLSVLPDTGTLQAPTTRQVVRKALARLDRALQG